MSSTPKISTSDEAWDDGALGKDEAFVKAVELPNEQERQIDDAFALQLISVRLQKSLIEDLKLIGQLEGIGYQPLMRQILKRFVTAEMKKIARDRMLAIQEQKERLRSEAAQAPRSERKEKVA